MDITWDTSELDQLAADLGKTPGRIIPAVTTIVSKGAHNIRRDAQTFSSGLKHAPHYPRSITWDLVPTLTTIAAEIGPDKNRPQGALGNLLEYGSQNNAPIAHLGPALDRETPGFVKALSDAAADIL